MALEPLTRPSLLLHVKNPLALRQPPLAPQDRTPDENLTRPQTLLMLLPIMACLAGTLSSVWEVFKENGIFRRECAAGLSPGPYLLSKAVVLGMISVGPGAGDDGDRTAFPRRAARRALAWLSPELELIVAVAALEFASMCLGLLVSAWVNSSENAIWAVVVLTMVQVVCCGGLFPVAGIPAFAQFAWVVPALGDGRARLRRRPAAGNDSHRVMPLLVRKGNARSYSSPDSGFFVRALDS